jgi:F-type H+-transporting ATPase subunit a
MTTTDIQLFNTDTATHSDSTIANSASTTVDTQQDVDEGHTDLVVHLKAKELFSIGDFPITNSMMTSLVGSLILVALVIVFSMRVKTIPGKMQSIFEIIVEKGYGYTESVLGNASVARKTFPLIASLFVFILFFNLIKFIPGAESLRYNGELFFKPLHKDLNMTLALGLTAIIFVQITGIFVLGLFEYSSKFINIKKPLSIPLGVIELISEAAKLVSLSFRLFGNMLVGGILLLLVSQVAHFVIPVPVILFEIFVAFLQAGIFALLTLIYVRLAIDEPH